MDTDFSVSHANMVVKHVYSHATEARKAIATLVEHRKNLRPEPLEKFARLDELMAEAEKLTGEMLRDQTRWGKYPTNINDN